MKTLVVLLTLILTISCSSDKTVEKEDSTTQGVFQLSEETSFDPNELVKESRAIKEQIQKGYIFKSSTDYDRDAMIRILAIVDSNLSNLSRENNIKNSIKAIDLAQVEFRELLLLKRDKPVVAPFMAKIEYINFVYANRYGVSISEPQGSAILNFNFDGKSVSPFTPLAISKDAPAWQGGSFRGTNYAIIETEGGKNQSWLISPKYVFDNSAIPLSLELSQVVRGLDRYESIKMLISENFDGRDPLTAKWEEYSLKDENYVLGDNGWRDYNTPRIDLKKYQDKTISIAFVLDTIESDAFTWEVISLKFIGLGKAPRQKAYFNLEFESKLTNIDELTQEVVEGNPVEFKNKKDSIEISGFRANQSGTRAIFSKTIDLISINKTMIEVDQSIRFYSRELQERGFLKIVALREQDFGQAEKYIELKISGSEKYILPESLQGQNIQLGFYYQHEHYIDEDGKDRYNAPSWRISGVKVFDLEPAK